jgi:transposase
MTADPRRRRVVIGVDTHKHIHVAVALDDVGGRLDGRSFPANQTGYQRLLEWARSFQIDVPGGELLFGIEGTGSYGAGLTSAIRRAGRVNTSIVEVTRPDRRTRRIRGKDDTLDAENAARAALSGTAAGTPKTGAGTVEMLRQIKIAKDAATKARTAAMVSLRTLLITADPALRETLESLTETALITRCAALRPGPVTTVTAATKHTLRALARRHQALGAEIKTHDKLLAGLTAALAPQLVTAYGFGPDTAATLLIAAGDNNDRLHSEGAFARLCGVAPIPASSGKITRHRLSRGGHRQANAALHRAVITRLRYHEPTRTYLQRRTAEGKTRREIIRCLKRLLSREVWALMRPLRTPKTTRPNPS